MDFAQKIEACFKAPEKLKELVDKVKETNSEEVTGLFYSQVKEAIDSVLNRNENKETVEIACSEFLAGEFSTTFVGNPVLFKEAQESAQLLFQEFNQDFVETAMAIYLENDGKVDLVDENSPVTYGHLYSLGEEDPLYNKEAKLSSAKRKSLSDSVFCGPNRSFPVNDRAHAVAAMRLLGRYKGPGDKAAIRTCIMRKAAKFGVGMNTKKSEGAVCFFPLYVKGSETLDPIGQVVISGEEALNETKEKAKEISDFYALSEEETEDFNNLLEVFEKIISSITIEGEDFDPDPLFEVEDIKTEAIGLGYEFLHRYFVLNNESLTKEHLLSLVGLTRKLKLSRKEIEESAKPYSVFSPFILETLLSSIPDEPESSVTEMRTEPEFPLTGVSETLKPIEKSEEVLLFQKAKTSRRMKSKNSPSV